MYINGKNYTKTQIFGRCSEILKKTDMYGFVDGEDFSFLMSVFICHPYWEVKKNGNRIVGIQKRPSGNYGSSCFWLVRDDDSITDISYRKVFDVDKQKKELLDALRVAVRPDIEEFRKTFVSFEYNGRMVMTLNEVEVDHYDMKFSELAETWIRLHDGVGNLYKYVSPTIDGSTHTYLTDESLVESFRKFHRENTHLRFLPKEVNRQIH